jgi:uncharacterized protein YvpB
MAALRAGGTNADGRDDGDGSRRSDFADGRSKRSQSRRRQIVRGGIIIGLCPLSPFTLVTACGHGEAGSRSAEVAGATAQRPPSGNDRLPPAVQLPVDADTAAYRQQRALSCEAASLHTALRLIEIDLPEVVISESEPRSEDPDEGFRGNINANQTLDDYGIHARGVLKTMETLKAGGALPKDLRGIVLHTINDVRAAIGRRQPVIVWIPLRLMAAQRVAVTFASGKTGYVVEHEHTVTLFGYSGDQYLALDPFDGSQPSYSSEALARGMHLFDDPALAIGRGS